MPFKSEKKERKKRRIDEICVKMSGKQNWKKKKSNFDNILQKSRCCCSSPGKRSNGIVLEILSWKKKINKETNEKKPDWSQTSMWKKTFASPNSTYVNVLDVKSPLSKPLRAVHGYQKNLPRLKKGNSTTEISDPLLYGADTPQKKDNTMKTWMNNK